ncbi:ArsR family transcriptional regulator [Jeotgalibacillus sp. S-D1]|uniref:helix-turn-helix domain-containing protein n=1 Tax=Jeotgalibacillus sp. S-D1 TaxID=2552189 RepID=UPI00105A914E|nr:helix-turn-helix domain-containing protein [Jeotgalibacillus sp. S-D1]TDL32786.1 ArsR family transcriptional regulator [Jeotgalibacillus sp. S-D1]
MTNEKIDLILHPIRLRIIQQLSKGPATVNQLKEWIADIPQATLYRHLNILKKDQLIYVVEEKKIRGAMERTFALEKEKPILSPQELTQMSGEEHLKILMTFLSNVTGQAKSYLLSNPDLSKDPFGYSQLDLHLTHTELEEINKGMNELLSKFISNKPSDQNQKVTLIQMLLPEPKDHKGSDRD